MQQMLRWLIVIVVNFLLIGCAPYWLRADVSRDLIFQTSTLQALLEGDYDGYMSVGALKLYGDFGLGTFDALDGEMVVLDGQVYQIRDDGLARISDDATITPFAVVTFFDVDQTIVLAEPMSCSDLQTTLDGSLATLKTPYAIKVDGTFDFLQVRAPRRQSKPYPPLTDALADQAIYEFNDEAGIMAGFRLPDSAEGANATGYHFHYLSNDRTTGGHVLDCQTQTVTVEIDTSAGWYVDITQNVP